MHARTHARTHALSSSLLCHPCHRHSASDAELASALIAVRGIGEWTCQMFMMFTLKRGNILPTGDLGVRKGMMIAFGTSL